MSLVKTFDEQKDLPSQPPWERAVDAIGFAASRCVNLDRYFCLRDLLLSHGIVLEWLRSVLRINRRSEDIVQSELSWEDVLHDTPGMCWVVRVRKAVQHICLTISGS